MALGLAASDILFRISDALHALDSELWRHFRLFKMQFSCCRLSVSPRLLGLGQPFSVSRAISRLAGTGSRCHRTRSGVDRGQCAQTRPFPVRGAGRSREPVCRGLRAKNREGGLATERQALSTDDERAQRTSGCAAVCRGAAICRSEQAVGLRCRGCRSAAAVGSAIRCPRSIRGAQSSHSLKGSRWTPPLGSSPFHTATASGMPVLRHTSDLRWRPFFALRAM